MEDTIEQALRSGLKTAPSLEAKRRLEELLGTIAPTSGNQLRNARAVGVLERIGTADAKEILKCLANGAAEARLTREARAARDRQERMSAKSNQIN